jgi:predicted DNA-binding protein (MmcQ/YjbR family)
MTAFSTVRRLCAAMPQAQPERKWGNVDTWLIVLDARGRPTDLWFKVDPERFLELTDRPGIRPAPYLARAGWVAVADPSRLALAELGPLLERSYRLVVAGLAQRVQRELGFEPVRRPAARAPRRVRATGLAASRAPGLQSTPRLMRSGG